VTRARHLHIVLAMNSARRYRPSTDPNLYHNENQQRGHVLGFAIESHALGGHQDDQTDKWVFVFLQNDNKIDLY
jgi:hypothetical protein